jgi:hypothetical protein
MWKRVDVKKRVGTAWPERESLWQTRSTSVTQVVAVVESASLCTRCLYYYYYYYYYYNVDRLWHANMRPMDRWIDGSSSALR